MTEPIIPEFLAEAVQTAVKRFPYFAVKHVRSGEMLYFEPNPAPFVLSSGGISAEIFSVQDEFCINIMQRSLNAADFNRMTEILKLLSIPFTVLEPQHFEICGFRLPE